MKFLSKHALPFVLCAALMVVAGCNERLDTGAACPVLCPHQQPTLRDTTFFAVTLDTSVAGFPAQGNETELYVASMADTLETIAVVAGDCCTTTPAMACLYALRSCAFSIGEYRSQSS